MTKRHIRSTFEPFFPLSKSQRILWIFCPEYSKAFQVVNDFDFQVNYYQNSTDIYSILLTYPDGFWMEITGDPSVLEVKTKPVTLQAFEEMELRITRDLFVRMKSIGLEPDELIGGGHINIGANEFAGDLLHFRNFIVDSWNHSELSMGIFYFPVLYNNYLPIPAMPVAQRERLRDIVKIADDGGYKNIQDFAKEIQVTGYNPVEGNVTEFSDGIPKRRATRYNTLSFASFVVGPVEGQRVEIRSLPPQKSFVEFLRLIRLFDARLDYLRSMTSPIPWNVPEHRSFTFGQRWKAFKQYVTESGLNFDLYSHFQSRFWQRNPDRNDSAENPLKKWYYRSVKLEPENARCISIILDGVIGW